MTGATRVTANGILRRTTLSSEALMGHRRATVLILLGALVCGCEKRSQSMRAPVAPAPATAPSKAATEPATQAATRPVSIINIDGHSLIFPAARLRFEEDGDRVVALLFSDDPPAALKDNYEGNSFYLQIPLEIDDAKKLAGATWTFKAT